MAPPVKVPKKPLKSMEKFTEPTLKTKQNRDRIKKKNYHGFSIYIFKLLKTVAKVNIGMSKKTMLIMNNFVNDMMEKIAEEAGKLVQHSKKSTMSSRDIQAAVRLLVPGELSKHANIEAMKAIAMFHRSHEQN